MAVLHRFYCTYLKANITIAGGVYSTGSKLFISTLSTLVITFTVYGTRELLKALATRTYMSHVHGVVKVCGIGAA